MSGKRAETRFAKARLSYFPSRESGGGKETRTPDPHAASVMLYQLSYAPRSRHGGDEEIRTPDPLLAKQVLYQLSYIPASGVVVLSLRRAGPPV